MAWSQLGGPLDDQSAAPAGRLPLSSNTPLHAEVLCRDPPLYAETPPRTRDGGEAGSGGLIGSGHCIAAASTKRWNGRDRDQAAEQDQHPAELVPNDVPSSWTNWPWRSAGNARPGCATLWGRRG